MNTHITTALATIERDEDIRILYACESGSRAWGFASPDSDYDVRFVYIHRPEWYLSIDDGRDVIERQGEGLLDISGWDIRKALRLFRKSNPPLLEWLRSPIVYLERYGFTRKLRGLADEFFSPRACLHHYLSMAGGNYREYLRGDEVKLKKYFYVLRPVLACMWIDRFGAPPPMEFAALLEAQALDSALVREIGVLLEQKMSGGEMGVGPRVCAINDFLDDRIAYLEQCATAVRQPTRPDSQALDVLFRETLAEAWGPRG